MEEVCNINILYKGKKNLISLPAQSTVEDLFHHLKELLNVAPETLKLIFQKGAQTDHVITLQEAKNTLSSVGILDGVKLLAVGGSVQDIENISTTKPNYRVVGFDQEEERARKRLYSESQVPNRPSTTPYFGGMETLQNMIFPSPLAALELLKDIAYHPGIVAIMSKHNWHVGVLAEMPPEGLVGIDKVCKLGYNVNHGEKIYLRLRTDDLKGFRRFDVILKTMLHELSHCDHMDHSDQFWKLFRQLENEIIQLDWTKSKGYVLGHGDPYGPKIDLSNNPTHTSENEIPKTLPTIVSEAPKSSPEHQTSIPNDISNSQHTKESPTTELDKPSANISNWSCEICTLINTSNHIVCEVCGTPKTAAKEPINQITSESSLINLHKSTTDIEMSLKSEIQNLAKGLTKQEASIVLKTIRTILGNILHSPQEEKFKKIAVTSNAYQQKIAKHPNARDILLKAGFEEDKQHSQLIFNRNDYGLVWLACSLIDEIN